MLPLIGLLASGIGSFFTGLFGWKGEQAKTVQQSLSTLEGLQDSESQSVVAQAQAIMGILTQGSFLERNWRAVLMVELMVLLTAGFFGYVPAHFNDPMSPMMLEVFRLLEIGLGGYIVRYGIRDMIREFNIAGIVKTLIAKKVL